MNIALKAAEIRKNAVRTVVNDIPTHLINAGYNTYSKIYKGQLSLGLPVAPELILNQKQAVLNAIGKLALTLYHTILKITPDEISQTIQSQVIKRDVLDDALEEWKSEKKVIVYDINGEPLENTSADEAVEEEEEVIEEGMADDVSEVAPAAGDVDENASPANVE